MHIIITNYKCATVVFFSVWSVYRYNIQIHFVKHLPHYISCGINDTLYYTHSHTHIDNLSDENRVSKQSIYNYNYTLKEKEKNYGIRDVWYNCDATQTHNRINIVDQCGTIADVLNEIQPKIQGLGVRNRQEATGTYARIDHRPHRILSHHE